jgi:hypothetical protein
MFNCIKGTLGKVVMSSLDCGPRLAVKSQRETTVYTWLYPQWASRFLLLTLLTCQALSRLHQFLLPNPIA